MYAADIQHTQLRPVPGGLLFCIAVGGIFQNKRQIRLSGAEPDFADDHIFDDDVVDFQFKWSFGRIGKVEIDSPLAVFSGDGLFFLFVELDCDLFAGISLAENRNFCPFCQHRMIGKNPRHNHLCA